MAPSWKERRLLCESMFILIDERTLILKNGGKKSFSYETKASMSFIPIRRMSYGAKIWKGRRLLCESVFVPINKQTLTLKNMEREAFLMNPKHQCHLSLPVEHIYGPRIMKIKEIIMWIYVCSNRQRNFDSKKWCEERLFKWNQSIIVIYPNEEN